MGSGMEGRLNNKLNETTTSYNNLKASTNISYKNSSISGLYESAKAQVQETTDEVERTTSSSSTSTGKAAQTIAVALSAITALAPVATTIISSLKNGSSKDAAGTNVDANLKAFQADASNSNRKTLEKDLAALRTQRDYLQATVDSKNAEIKTLTDKIASEKENGSETKSVKAEIAQIDEELTGADKTKGYGKAMADVEAKDAEITTVTTQISDIESKNTETVTARDNAQKAKEDAETKSADYVTKISTAEGELPGLKSDLSSIEAQLKTAKSEDGKKITVTTADGQSVQQKKDNSAEINKLTEKVEAAKAKVEAKEKEIKELKESKKAQDDIVEAKTKEIEGYNKSMTDGDTNVKDLLAKKETLTTEKTALQETADAEKSKLTTRRQELQNSLTAGVVNDLQAKVTALTAEVKDIEDKQLAPLNTKIASVEKALGVTKTTDTDADKVVEGSSSGKGTVSEEEIPETIRRPSETDVDNDTSVASMDFWAKQDISPKNGEKTKVDGKEYTFQNGVWKDDKGNEYRDQWGKPAIM